MTKYVFQLDAFLILYFGTAQHCEYELHSAENKQQAADSVCVDKQCHLWFDMNILSDMLITNLMVPVVPCLSQNVIYIVKYLHINVILEKVRSIADLLS